MRKISLLFAVAALGGLTSVGYAAKKSDEYPTAYPMPLPAEPAPANGSIFAAGNGYAPLHTGNRARSVGDPLTVLLVETTRTSKSAGSTTDREGGFSITPPTSGPLGFLNPNALKASGESSFKGQGVASQSSTLSSQLGVTIAQVFPNGTALVRGEKHMMLSQGDEWVQFSGLVRLSDIDEDNRIVSSRIADARIVYSGKGSIQRASRPGWLMRFFNIISPF